ncbi:hypothetical protein Bca52824_081891 [Brassica carinata]|uniref:Reverse transcriptase zinc-binding domain-containing protein n=1 Tax=Brassica carinata TaxID=52824 RepID=A0A8X7PI70_BRACI|nr:hypothetical protein Bca52824_081891 [Brassica carinata]
MPQRRHSCSPRPSLGQNLNITDFPPLTTIQEKEHSNNVATRRSPRSQWRVISTTPDQEATSRHRWNHSPRAGGEVNLGMDVLPQPRGLPTLESVMEELNESTLQYLNVEDPVERAARQKRVLQTEIDGTVEETTARILRNSTANALADAGLAASHTTEPTPQVPSSDTKAVKPVRRRGRPARINTSRTTIRLSPKTYAGMGSRKRKLAQRDQDLFVSDLICRGSGDWNIPRIITSPPHLLPQILRLRPSITGAPDSFAWLATKSGTYSVKSGYYVATTLRNAEIREVTEAQRVEEHTLCKAIWTAKVSPKIQLFLWKITHRALPLGENLAKRGLLNHITCRHCGELETAEHLFIHCSFSNQLIFENRVFEPMDIFSKAISSAREWNNAQASLTSPQVLRNLQSPPSHQPLTELPYFTDAAWISFEGDILFQRSCVFEFITSALMAEALSIRSALVHASEAGIFKICIKSDCQALIALFGIIRDIETLFLRFSCISFSFIPRSVNCMADTLAKSVLHSAFPN